MAGLVSRAQGPDPRTATGLTRSLAMRRPMDMSLFSIWK